MPAIVKALLSTLAGIAVGGRVLPAVDGFPLLVLVLAPVFLGMGLTRLLRSMSAEQAALRLLRTGWRELAGLATPEALPERAR